MYYNALYRLKKLSDCTLKYMKSAYLTHEPYSYAEILVYIDEILLNIIITFFFFYSNFARSFFKIFTIV